MPLTRKLVELFKGMPRGLPAVKVFTLCRAVDRSHKDGFYTGLQAGGDRDFTFDDLRHPAINNWRLQGHDYFRIMAATGHKTMTVFKRYNTVSKEELKALVGEKI